MLDASTFRASWSSRVKSLADETAQTMRTPRGENRSGRRSRTSTAPHPVLFSGTLVDPRDLHNHGDGRGRFVDGVMSSQVPELTAPKPQSKWAQMPLPAQDKTPRSLTMREDGLQETGRAMSLRQIPLLTERPKLSARFNDGPKLIRGRLVLPSHSEGPSLGEINAAIDDKYIKTRSMRESGYFDMRDSQTMGMIQPKKKNKDARKCVAKDHIKGLVENGYKAPPVTARAPQLASYLAPEALVQDVNYFGYHQGEIVSYVESCIKADVNFKESSTMSHKK